MKVKETKIPMIQVYLSKPEDPYWMTVSDSIKSMDNVEWFDDLKGWQTKKGSVMVNGKLKECDIYLSADNRGWVNFHIFYPPITL